MRTHLDCVGCLVRQALDIARQNIPEDLQRTFIRDVLKSLGELDFDSPPPIMAMEMYGMLRETLGIHDPYAEVKYDCNSKALALYPRLKEILASSADPFDAGVRMAVAGNIIDFAAGDHRRIPVEETLERALAVPFAIDHTDRLRQRVTDARSILYLADNAGEIVFDRVLIEELGPERVTCAVRDIPVINDATMQDAIQTGLDKVCTVISSGSPAPGTPLGLCTEEFRQLFYGADVVISKGQGNLETLCAPGRDVFFLFMVKCPIISGEVGAEMNSFIVMESC